MDGEMVLSVAGMEALSHFSLLHNQRLFAPVLDDGDGFTRMDLMRADRMAVQIPDRLDGVDGAVDFDFVTFHRFLDRLADVA